MKRLILYFFLTLSVCSYAADTLAVVEPTGKGGITPAEIETFWGMLESSVKSREYKLISRSALKQMLTEAGFSTSSGLQNPNAPQKAQLGRIEGVKYLLIAEIGKFGSGIQCTLRILESSTGEIDPNRTASVRVPSLDALADQIDVVVEKMLSDKKQLARSALLAPVISIRNAPPYLFSDFNTGLENALLKQGLKLQNLQSVAKILKDNNLAPLAEMEPKFYRRVGQLLEVEYLIQATVNRFEILSIPFRVAESGAAGFRYIGNIGGNVRVVSARTGELVASVPFSERVDYRKLPRTETRNWTATDYGKYMIDTVVPLAIMPELTKLPLFSGK